MTDGSKQCTIERLRRREIACRKSGNPIMAEEFATYADEFERLLADLAVARSAEREACASVLDSTEIRPRPESTLARHIRESFAAAIRARGNT